MLTPEDKKEIAELAAELVEIPEDSAGNALYYMNMEADWPVPEAEIRYYIVQKSTLSNSGAGINVGDMIVAANGILCKVSGISGNTVHYDPIGTVRGITEGEGSGGDAEDVFSPIAKVEQTDTGAVISITDKDGTTTATITNGQPGQSGEKGDKGDKGDPVEPRLRGEQGIQDIQGEPGARSDKGDKGDTGAAGANGKIPVRGVDYWTEADQESIVQKVITALATPVFGRVDAENNIILIGELVDGTYTIKYEDADGNVTEIGTLNNNPVPTYTNLFVAETCQLKKRTNSSGNVSDNTGGFLTDYIDLGDAIASGGTNVLHYKNMYFHTTNWVNGSYEVYSFICYYDSSKKFLKTAGQREIADVLSADGDYTKTLDATLTSARFIRVTALILPNPGATTQITALTSKDQLANCKLALNETITD